MSVGYVFPIKKTCLDSKTTSWDLKNRIPRRKLRIQSYSQVCRSKSGSKYFKKCFSIGFGPRPFFYWFIGLKRWFSHGKTQKDHQHIQESHGETQEHTQTFSHIPSPPLMFMYVSYDFLYRIVLGKTDIRPGYWRQLSDLSGSKNMYVLLGGEFSIGCCLQIPHLPGNKKSL